MEIAGHAALISGGASGLGQATAAALSAAGAKVALLDIDGAAAQTAANPLGGLGLACDVTDATATERAVAAARERHGPARIVVNCAGIGRAGRIVERDGSAMPLDQFKRVVEVNLIGSFNLLRLAAADMATLDPLADGERGVVVLTASVAAYDGQIGQAAYSASKGGIVGLTLPAARELARYGIRWWRSPPACSRRRCSPAYRKRRKTASGHKCRFHRGSVILANMPPSCSISAPTACSTAKSSVLTARCACRRGRQPQRRSRSGAISSIASACLMSRSLSPSASWVDRMISTRL
jgi:NADP-dependent 3-hydroxy acid dehydrogenase YdfG